MELTSIDKNRQRLHRWIVSKCRLVVLDWDLELACNGYHSGQRHSLRQLPKPPEIISIFRLRIITFTVFLSAGNFIGKLSDYMTYIMDKIVRKNDKKNYIPLTKFPNQ